MADERPEVATRAPRGTVDRRRMRLKAEIAYEKLAMIEMIALRRELPEVRQAAQQALGAVRVLLGMLPKEGGDVR